MDNIRSFAQHSAAYAQHRPRYPEQLFAFLSAICAGHDCAWDCATGSGQAAVACAAHFACVEATDLSAEQIQHCIAHPRVRYSVAPAEQTAFAAQSFDCVMVAQALHWFDRERFFQEVDRVLRPGGALAIWGYGLFTIAPEIDRIVAEQLFGPIDRFWAEGNRELMDGYRACVLPFEPIPATPALSVRVEWDLGELLAYLRTWSAVKRYVAELGEDPVAGLGRALAPQWGSPDAPRLIEMPLALRVSRKPA